MTPFRPSRYLTHFGGVSSLLAWSETWRSLAREIKIDGPRIVLGSTASRRFGIGIPRSPRVSDIPSLLAQKDESQWLEAIRWDRVVLDPEENRIWLRAAYVDGDQQQWPDIPAFAVGIMVDFPEKILPLLQFKGMELRGLWREEKEWRIDAGPARSRWRLEQRVPGTSIFKKGETRSGRSFEDLVSSRLAASNRPVNPGFKGGLSIPPELRAQMKEELQALGLENQ